MVGPDSIPYQPGNLFTATLARGVDCPGGPIAIEMTQAFHRLGSLVKVIQRCDQILTKEVAIT
jgi:hypothetical protein